MVEDGKEVGAGGQRSYFAALLILVEMEVEERKRSVTNACHVPCGWVLGDLMC
jgi:hypothetical protein